MEVTSEFIKDLNDIIRKHSNKGKQHFYGRELEIIESMLSCAISGKVFNSVFTSGKIAEEIELEELLEKVRKM
jgi:hypothetical protein